MQLNNYIVADKQDRIIILDCVIIITPISLSEQTYSVGIMLFLVGFLCMYIVKSEVIYFPILGFGIGREKFWKWREFIPASSLFSHQIH